MLNQLPDSGVLRHQLLHTLGILERVTEPAHVAVIGRQCQEDLHIIRYALQRLLQRDDRTGLVACVIQRDAECIRDLGTLGCRFLRLRQEVHCLSVVTHPNSKPRL